MGRAGAGGNSGGHSSSHHSSGSRSSSHHSVGSSRASGSSGYRAGSGLHGSSYYSSHRNHYGGYGSPPIGGYGGYGGFHRGWRNTSVSVFTTILVLVIFMVVMYANGSGGVPKSTSNREKVNTGVAYQNDCIVDELGWFDNIPKTEKRLQSFYEKTGIQPYIVLRDYDAMLQTTEQMDAYAEQWYDDHIDNEGTLLFMYFAAQDTENDVGEMTCINGKQITSVMDAEALDIFWAYIDNNWYSDASTDDMFVKVFDSTAKRIMTKSTTGMDVMKLCVIFVMVVAAGVFVVVVLKMKYKRAREEAAETERILNAPLSSSSDDELIDRYNR